MKIYKTGLILTILSWLASLNPFWIMYTGPAFLTAQLVVWFSEAKIKTKFLTTFLPLLLWVPGFVTFFFLSKEYMTPETFLVPKDFRGGITLIYDEPCGQTVPKVEGRLIYKIPDNGVMTLTNKFETGVIDQEYYFVDDNWNKIEKIPKLDQRDFNEDYPLEKNQNEPPRNKVGLFLIGTGGGSSLKNKDYKFHTMAVNSWDSLRAQKTGALTDRLFDSLLYECRQKK